MEVEATIRRQGNSIGIVLSQPIVRELRLTVGQTVTLQTTPEGLMIKLKRKRKRYTSAELNALCNPKAPMPVGLQDWENMPAAVSEAA